MDPDQPSSAYSTFISFVSLIHRRKIPVAALRDAIFYSKRMTGQVARSLGLVDDVKEDSKMADAGKALVQSAVGRNKLGRQIFQQMKKDLYLSDAVSKL